MIELGGHARLEHYKVGYNASMTCDYVMVTNKNFIDDIKKGAQDSGGKCQIITGDSKVLAKIIKDKTNRSSDSIVVFISKEAASVLKKLI